MTPEQREAVLERMTAAIKTTPAVDSTDRDLAVSALDALLSEFVVIPKDDVIERFGSNNAGERSRRLVTRWEPITEEDENAVDAGESIVPGLQTDSTGGTA